MCACGRVCASNTKTNLLEQTKDHVVDGDLEGAFFARNRLANSKALSEATANNREIQLFGGGEERGKVTENVWESSASLIYHE